MAFNPVKDAGAVTQFHGGVLQIKVATATGGSDSGNWYDLGYFRKAEIDDTRSSEAVTDGAGDQIATLSGERKITLTVQGLQRNKANLTFVDNPDATYWVYFKASKTGAYSVSGVSKTMELVFPIAEIEPSLKLDFSGKSEMEMKFLISKVPSAASVTLTSMAGSHTPTASSPVIVNGTDANPYYSIQEG